MANVATYLNFPGNTEDAFNHYKSIFGGEFVEPIMRYKDMPPQEGAPAPLEQLGNMVMHMEYPIIGGHKLMGSDAPSEMGFNVNVGNNSYIMLELDSKEEADRIFNELSEGGRVEMPMADMFWGAYFGSLADKYGVQWMINVSNS